MNTPTPLGLKKSFGYGDRLGLATPGHIRASRQFDFAPIFAQQSIREMTRTQRSPQDVMAAAQEAVTACGYREPWGADADHLKTSDDVRATAKAGFCFYTIDPSAHVNNQADQMSVWELEGEVAKLENEGILPDGWHRVYMEHPFEVSEGLTVRFQLEDLYGAAVKYGRAIAHAVEMGREIAEANANRGFEIEISVDETDTPTSTAEHLFFGLELRRRGMQGVVSLAPRFVGEFEKGIDYRGDIAPFEATLREHLAIAKYCGPYKLSVHSGSDKFGIYPVVGRVCGDLLHVKTAGTSYLEALRVVARRAEDLFREIAAFATGRFERDRQSYHISTTQAEIQELPEFRSVKEEGVYLDERVGRQLLHVTFGSVLTEGARGNGQKFKEAILEVLERNSDLHMEVIEKHFVKHLSLLSQG